MFQLFVTGVTGGLVTSGIAYLYMRRDVLVSRGLPMDIDLPGTLAKGVENMTAPVLSSVPSGSAVERAWNAPFYILHRSVMQFMGLPQDNHNLTVKEEYPQPDISAFKAKVDSMLPK